MSIFPHDKRAEDAEILTYTIEESDHGERLDKLCVQSFPALSRTRLKALILEGALTLDDQICTSPSYKVKAGSVLRMIIPPVAEAQPGAENIPLDILYEDEFLLVLNKQAGLIVHPGAGNPDGTLVNALLHHCGESLSGIGGVRRPGIVHRLDKDTSGVMVIAKSDQAHQNLSAQLADRTLGRHYKALIWGVPQPRKGFVNQPIGRHTGNRLKMAVTQKNSRTAGTHYEREDTYQGAVSMVNCRLESGRTHQIRVHMAFIKHPVLGDPLYGQQRNAGESALKKAGYESDHIAKIMAFSRQALHAWKIEFLHPCHQQKMVFETALPDDIRKLITLLQTPS